MITRSILGVKHTFLTNVSENNEDLILQAAKETGYDISIERPARDIYDNKVSGSAVYSNTEGEHGPFWKRYNKLLEARNNNAQVD